MVVPAMDSVSMDHYEKQLYTVFKTFDVDNDEALDRSAVLDLCDALQLEERGAALVETLFERPSDRVTFTHFRNGLLSVLGAGCDSAVTSVQAATPAPAAVAATASAPTHSDDDSSGREVAPKFVFGSKKYGRRSRPQTGPTPSCSDTNPSLEVINTKQMKCKHYNSTMDLDTTDSAHDSDLDHDRHIDYDQALILCQSLHMDRIDRKMIRQLFVDASSNEMTVGEFFDRLNMSLTMSIASSCDIDADMAQNNNEADAAYSSSLTSDVIVEAWERAGVEHARRLLCELGFTGTTVRAAELARALDHELSALNTQQDDTPDARSLLLQATVALYKLRLTCLRQTSDAAHSENTKLRADLVESNHRAQSLAQEVDENHARIEGTLKGRIRQLEHKHLEELRAATAEWSVERERLSTSISKLETTLLQLKIDETRLKNDANLLREQNEELSRRASLAEERFSDVERLKNNLSEELKSLAESRLSECAVDDGGVSADLRSRLEVLQLENKQLRDRNDELCVELESVQRTSAGQIQPRRHSSTDPLPLRLLPAQSCNDECDQSFTSLDQKVIGHIEVVRKLQGVLENVSQVSFTDDSGCESCGTLKSIITLIQERVQELSDSVILADQSGLKLDSSIEASVQTDGVDAELEKLRKEFAEGLSKHENEKDKLSSLVKELENSLYQMKVEYDKCEEYWTNKLEEERDIYNEEQRLSDERLSELISKISEYEQQFAPKTGSNQLPTIDEKYSLELQFNDLEDEFEKYKKEKEKDIEAKTDEINKLKEKIHSYEEKAVTNGHENGVVSNTSSPIDYLWNQGTIHSPFKSDKRSVRDYQNPAFAQRSLSKDWSVRCASDGERDGRAVHPIQRPALAGRSVSADALRPDARDEPHMIQCAELEGQLRHQAQTCGASSDGRCFALETRCRQLAAALRQRQLCLDALQQTSRVEGAAMRARVSAAEGAVARLQARLAAADLLVKELYLENCQLHHHSRLL